jgi:hypothetical protein
MIFRINFHKYFFEKFPFLKKYVLSLPCADKSLKIQN